MVWVKTERKVVGDAHGQSDLQLRPDSELSVVPFDGVKENLVTGASVLREPSKHINMLWSTLASSGIYPRRYQLLVFIFIITAQLPLSCSDRKRLKTAQESLFRIEPANNINCILGIICANSHVLSSHLHIIGYR